MGTKIRRVSMKVNKLKRAKETMSKLIPEDDNITYQFISASGLIINQQRFRGKITINGK